MKRTNHDVEAVIGERIRLARTIAGMSQTDLGSQCGVTFQQIQKYEKGTNRVSASRLVQIAKLTGQPLSFFLGEDTPTMAGFDKADIALVQAFSGISKETKRALADFAVLLDRG